MAKRCVDRQVSGFSFVPHLQRMFPIPFSQPVIGVLWGNWAEFHGFFVEETEIQIHKIDPPDAILLLFKADRLIGQGLADEESLLPAEVDAPNGSSSIAV